MRSLTGSGRKAVKVTKRNVSGLVKMAPLKPIMPAHPNLMLICCASLISSRERERERERRRDNVIRVR